MMQSVMLDLETMDTSPNAAIIAIGAVKFDDGRVMGGFYDMINLDSCVSAGLTIDPGTIVWWMQQSEEARSVFKEDRRDLSRVLFEFGQWMGDNDDTEVWGNGSDFDNVILTNAYRKCSMALPWNYKNNRCYRTMKNMYKSIEIEKIGTEHCAVDDARSQALHLIKILIMHIENFNAYGL